MKSNETSENEIENMPTPLEPLAKKSRNDEVEDQIVKMLARTNISFRFTEDPFFVELINRAYPRMKLNKRQYFSTEVLPRVANEVISRLRHDIGNKPYAITSDGWSSPCKPSPTFYRYF